MSTPNVKYAGEYVRIAATSKVEEAPGIWRDLVPDDIESATVSIASAQGKTALASTELTYDETFSMWTYFWDTSGFAPGEYRAKVTIVGVGHRSWEYTLINLYASEESLVITK